MGQNALDMAILKNLFFDFDLAVRIRSKDPGIRWPTQFSNRNQVARFLPIQAISAISPTQPLVSSPQSHASHLHKRRRLQVPWWEISSSSRA